MPEIVDAALSHPTMWEFLKLVLAKGRAKEKNKWLAKYGEVIVAIIAAVPIAVLTGSYAGLYAGAITGLFGLLLLAAPRFMYFCLVGSHKLHCEQLDLRRDLKDSASATTSELDSANKTIAARPLDVVEVKRSLRVLARWLQDQPQNQTDLSEQKEKYLAVVRGLLPQYRWDWETTDFRGKSPGVSDSFITHKSSLVMNRLEEIATTNDYSTTWRPPEWLVEYGKTVG